MPTLLKDPVTGETKKHYSRKECGLPPTRAPKGAQLRKEWIVHHGVGKGSGLSLSALMAIWRGYYRYHVETKGWTDIGYSFGFCDAHDVDGATFEGRGWGINGGHTQNGGNTRGHACCYIGDGRYTEGSDGAWEAHRALLAHGVAIGHVTADHRVTGHDDWWNKVCPGPLIKAVIKIKLKLTGGSPGKDWFDMATEADLERVVRKVMDERSPYLMHTAEGKWYVLNDSTLTGSYIGSPDNLNNLRQVLPTKDTGERSNSMVSDRYNLG